jgi:hypothetical protein
VDLEHARKDAKRLARAVRSGDEEAVARAARVLGERIRERFLLTDAQHVVAVEHGYRSWRELRAAQPAEEVIATGREYAPGDPVLLRVTRRRLVWIDDRGGAVARAGTPAGWRDVAERLADGLVVNISRHGVVSLPVSRGGPGYEAIVRRIAEASLALHQDILDLDE